MDQEEGTSQMQNNLSALTSVPREFWGWLGIPDVMDEISTQMNCWALN